MNKTKRVLPTRGPGRPPGTDKNSAHTREHLLETARALLAEKGLGQLSLREIADRAQVNPALLHYYFGSKDDLRAALQESSFADLTERLARVAPETGSAAVRLESVIRALVDGMFADPTLHRLVLQHALGSDARERERFDEDFVKPINTLIGRIVQDGIKAGSFPAGEDDLYVSSILGIVVTTLLFALRESANISSARKKAIVDHCVHMTLRGLSA